MTVAYAPKRRALRTKRIDLRQMDLEEIYELSERLAGRPVPGVRMTEAEFEARSLDRVRAEWVDGEVFLMAPVSDEHNSLNIWLVRLIGAYVEENDLGTIRSDIFVRLTAQRRRRVPDLLFVGKDRLDLLKPTYLDGAPDLIVEIVSEDSQSRDRREKYQEYEKAGVREYWIIDPLSKTAEAYRLEKKKFALIEERDGVIESRVLPRFRLKTQLLWRRPLPKVAQALRQMRRR